MSFHEEMKEKYLAAEGVRCFFCFSYDIEGSSLDVNEGQVSQEIVCNKCGAHWTDLYKLTDVTDIRRS